MMTGAVVRRNWGRLKQEAVAVAVAAAGFEGRVEWECWKTWLVGLPVRVSCEIERRKQMMGLGFMRRKKLHARRLLLCFEWRLREDFVLGYTHGTSNLRDHLYDSLLQ